MQSNWHDQEKHGIDIVLTLQEVQLRRKEKEKKKKNIPREWLKIFSSSYIQKPFIQPPSQARPWDNSRAMMVSKRDRSGKRWSVDVLVSVLPMKTVIMILRKYCHIEAKIELNFEGWIDFKSIESEEEIFPDTQTVVNKKIPWEEFWFRKVVRLFGSEKEFSCRGDLWRSVEINLEKAEK